MLLDAPREHPAPALAGGGQVVVATPPFVARTPQEWGALVRADLARSVEGFVAAGRHLSQAKADLPHGEWLRWIERELPIGASAVQKLMAVAEHPAIANAEHAQHLPPRWDSLYELSRMEPLQLEAAIADGAVTPELERKRAKALVAEYRIRRPGEGIVIDAEQDADQSDVSGADAATGLVSTVVADPPWRYGNTATRAAAEDHYPTMSIDELCDLDIASSRAADQAHLYLWTTSSHLPEAFRVMAAWGFEYKTYLVWVKPQMGMGNYFRVSTELVLFGIKGKLRTQDRATRNWFNAPRTKHSAKPETFHDLVMRCSPGPYLELFARCYREEQLAGTCRCSKCRLGWDVWGNQS